MAELSRVAAMFRPRIDRQVDHFRRFRSVAVPTPRPLGAPTETAESQADLVQPDGVDDGIAEAVEHGQRREIGAHQRNCRSAELGHYEIERREYSIRQPSDEEGQQDEQGGGEFAFVVFDGLLSFDRQTGRRPGASPHLDKDPDVD